MAEDRKRATTRMRVAIRLWPDDLSPSRDILLQAQRFHVAASILKEHFTGGKFYLLPSFTTLAAFTVELCLKCLLSMQGGNVPAEHDLEELFRNLNRPTKATLKRRFRIATANDPSASDLESELARSKDAFVLMRYVYERGEDNGRGFGLWPLIPSMMEVILEREPNWKDLPLIYPEQVAP